MSKIKNYEDFIKDNQSKTGKVDESNYMAKYSSLEFKNMFSDKILETPRITDI